jgi:hypothetical protein
MGPAFNPISNFEFELDKPTCEKEKTGDITRRMIRIRGIITFTCIVIWFFNLPGY